MRKSRYRIFDGEAGGYLVGIVTEPGPRLTGATFSPDIRDAMRFPGVKTARRVTRLFGEQGEDMIVLNARWEEV